MTRIALGTAQFGSAYGISNQSGQVSEENARKIISIAVARGVHTLDTAVGYGNSEAILGRIGVGSFRVITKLPALPEGVRSVGGWVREQVRLSIKRLKIKKLYGVLLHRPQDLTGEEGQKLYYSLCEIQKEGMSEKIGISVYHPAELEQLFGTFSFGLVQAPFNLIDRRLKKSGWLRRLSGEGVEVHVRSVFLQGLLLLPQLSIPPEFARWAGTWRNWQGWLEHNKVRALDACLAYVLSFPEIHRVVVGTEKPEQLEMILSSRPTRSSENWPDIESEDEDLILPYRWNIGTRTTG
jgi:aryl-alcohol dehydrogenase-like predicted oxidoreductase